MSGNRISLKNGLFVGAMLATAFYSYAEPCVQLSSVEEIENKMKRAQEWADTLANLKARWKTVTRESFFGTLQKLISDTKALEASIPDIPKANRILKNMLKDLIMGLEHTHTALSSNETILQVKQYLAANLTGGDYSLKPMLDKANRDLNELIEHAKTNPDEYEAGALEALKTFKATTFKKFYDQWHAVNSQKFIDMITLAIKLK